MPWSGGTFNRANGATGWADDQSAGIGIESGRHDTQDNDFRNGINECINAAGQNAATGNLPMGGFKHTNVGNAAANDQYAAYGQVVTLLGQYMPAGAMVQYGGAAAPTGWLLCDGTAVNRTTYAALFAAIGSTYGNGDGLTTFNVPDLRQRFPLGKAASGTGNTLGGTGGSIDHTHTSAAHTHTIPAHYHGMGTGATLAAASGGTHTHVINAAASATGFSSPTKVGRVSGGTDADITTGDNGDGSSPDGAHSHSITGLVGLVTGGVDGNAAMTSGSTTPSATGSNNPPYVVVNYIIRT
jgi:microcystin-dependent protein